MLKKIKCFGDFVEVMPYVPHLFEMSIEGFICWFNEENDDFKWGWYWDDEKKELFRPYIIKSEPGWDILFIMKDKMGKDDDFPHTDIINFMYGQTFYNKEDGFRDEDIFKDYIDNH